MMSALKEFQCRARMIRAQLKSFDSNAKDIVSWAQNVLVAANQTQQQQGWLTGEFYPYWLSKRPRSNLDGLWDESEIILHVQKQDVDVQESIRIWRRDFHEFIQEENEKHLRSEMADCRDFFDRVEKAPLTTEQARAVVCFDTRVQVIASAGSGKTSTMVAKAGYALHRKLVSADRILLLAFNADAAKELQVRIRERLKPLGFPADHVMARTFHAFGLDVIGQATGKKPTLAPWLESGGDLEQLSVIIEALKERDSVFRRSWDLFRIVFSRDLPKFNADNDPEDWDGGTKEAGFRTLQGEVVKSHQERIIADWLFYNGVEYRYEHSYEVDTANKRYRQYRPDFYYPAAHAYHEHFALDANGNPPLDFEGYMDGVVWKRGIHKETGTTLWETTSADLWSGNAFHKLTLHFEAAKVPLNPDANRPVPGRKVIEHREMVRTFRTFLTHVKSNRLSPEDLLSRLGRQAPDSFRFRHHLFLNLFEAIRSEWEKVLHSANVIDFEDMLNLAADHLEAERWHSPYDLVMVDEFQDASRARARMVKALVQKPGKRLFAVGDDWQSINRFAGADISVMTDFESWFGKGSILRLEQTFRCPQSICNVSSEFVMKNPRQLKKKVISTQSEVSPSVQIIQVASENRIQDAIDKYLAALNDGLSTKRILPGKSGLLEVFVLGRYRVDSGFISSQWAKKYERINVKFSTIHGAKGLEADYVIMPRLTRGAYGFPSRIEDDPILQLAMPEGDVHPFAEERRLFYVALTRARRSVAIVTIENHVSEFVVELVKEHGIQLQNVDGKPVATIPCPLCRKGVMVPRTGKNGRFWGCSRFPQCRKTANTMPDAEGRALKPTMRSRG